MSTAEERPEPKTLDDRGILAALLGRGCIEDHVARIRRADKRLREPRAKSPFILPGMARVTTDAFSDRFGALVHVPVPAASSEGTAGIETYHEQWLLCRGPAASVTLEFNDGYTFTGTPEAYPKRLPWLRSDQQASPTTWLGLVDGKKVTPKGFYCAKANGKDLDPAVFVRASAVVAVQQVDAGSPPPLSQQEYLRSGEGPLRWEEWLQDVSGSKAWVYGEWGKVDSGSVKRVIHMAWADDYAPLPAETSRSQVNPSNSLGLEEWLADLPSRFGGKAYTYARSVLSLPGQPLPCDDDVARGEARR
jgi:hypothetical protein